MVDHTELEQSVIERYVPTVECIEECGICGENSALVWRTTEETIEEICMPMPDLRIGKTDDQDTGMPDGSGVPGAASPVGLAVETEHTTGSERLIENDTWPGGGLTENPGRGVRKTGTRSHTADRRPIKERSGESCFSSHADHRENRSLCYGCLVLHLLMIVVTYLGTWYENVSGRINGTLTKGGAVPPEDTGYLRKVKMKTIGVTTVNDCRIEVRKRRTTVSERKSSEQSLPRVTECLIDYPEWRVYDRGRRRFRDA